MLDTKPLLLNTDFPQLQRDIVHTLQVNLGYRCNLSCVHCHVNAGPNRTEEASPVLIDQIVKLLDVYPIKTVDLTGGAPELNPGFKSLVEVLRTKGVRVIDRCNLTVLFEPGQENTAEFLAENEVEITASLPCYSEANVNQQRGKGVFQQSIEALQLLNNLGYGKHKNKVLNLVYNPVGPSLPPEQGQLQSDYKERLYNDFGIVFDELLTITNMPISRFGGVLLAKGQFDSYMSLLKGSYSDSNLAGVMCRNLLSIDWQGYVYDCDFNQMLGCGSGFSNSEVIASEEVIASDSQQLHVDDLLDNPENLSKFIKVGEHCYGCTAGQGSSCGGALSS